MNISSTLHGFLHLLAVRAQRTPGDLYEYVGNPHYDFSPDPSVLSPGRRQIEDITASRVASYRDIPLSRFGYNV